MPLQYSSLLLLSTTIEIMHITTRQNMKTKISITSILLLIQISLAFAQSQLEPTLKWTTQDDKKIVACTVKNISEESITIYEREYKPMTFIFPDGHRTFPYRPIICGPFQAKNMLLSPDEQRTVFYDPNNFFGNTFTSRKPKEHGEYQILWEVKGAESNVLTYQFVNPYMEGADFSNDPNIIWAAETETLFHFNIADYEGLIWQSGYLVDKPKTVIGAFQTIKSDFSNLPVSTSSKILEHELGRLIQNKATQFLNVKNNRISWDSVQKLVSIDKYEDGVRLNPAIPKGTFSYENGQFNRIKSSFIVRQIWYYHKEDKQLKTKVIAISPVIPFPSILNNDCTEQRYNPETFARFGWIKLPQSPDFDFNVNRKNLLWSRLSKHDYDFKNARILKGNTEKMLYQLFYQKPLNDEVAVYSADNFTKKSLPLTNVEFKEILASRMDTVNINFDPKTYQETYNLEQSPEIKLGDISKFQITQQWYWDANLQQLAVKLKTMRLQVGIKDKNDKIKWQKPLYILKFD
jgi:hypothetical protein